MNRIERLTRHHRLPLRVLAVLTGLILLSVVPYHLKDGTTPARNGDGVASLQGVALAFAITGRTAEPIAPGRTVPLDLEFTNDHDVSVTVSDLNVTVIAVRAPKANAAQPCTSRDFAVRQGSRDLHATIAGRSTSRLSTLGVPVQTWPRVAMLDLSSNQDGCKGASLTLGYTASGTPQG